MPTTSPDRASLDGAATRKQSHKSSSVQTRIHNRDARARSRIIDALMSSGIERECVAGAKVRECCRSPLILINEGGQVAITLCRCRHRMCPTCSRLRGLDASVRLGNHVKTMNAPRFITLTLKAGTEPLNKQVDRLLKCFRQLRRVKAWGDCVVGGVATIECTWSASSQSWHPHIHAIVDGSYFPQPQLKRAWMKATGDSYIVDVRKVNDATQAARYVASYMCKHGSVGSWSAERIREYATAMHGRRMLQTFGNQHGLEHDEKPKEERPEGMQPLATVREMIDLAGAGFKAAIETVRWSHRLGGAWRVLFPADATAKMHPCPPGEDEVLDSIVAAAREVRRRSEAPEKKPPGKLSHGEADRLLIVPGYHV